MAAAAPATATTAKINIIHYSLYGHIEAMSRAFKEGVDSVDGVEGVLLRVPETLSEDVLAAMHAPPKAEDIAEADRSTFVDCDGIAFGIPTRFGMMAAQMKTFFDGTGSHWQKGTLLGKPAALFVSTGTQGGGQETTALTALTQLSHHGMIFVPYGYQSPEVQFDTSSVHGGSAYGAGCFAGADGSRKPSEAELSVAKAQGAYFAKTALALKKGRSE